MIRKCSWSDVKRTTKRRYGKRINDIEAFLASGDDCCEYVMEPGERAKYVQSSFLNAIAKRSHYRDSVYCTTNGGRVFLCKFPEKRKENRNA